MIVPLEIKQLGDMIKNTLPKESFDVIGEVSQPKISRGNVYLNLKDSFYTIKAIIWKSKIINFNCEIKDGDKITVRGKLDYYGGTGTVSFIIEKLVKHQGEGELFFLYKKYKNDFEKKGYFLPNEKINIPKKIESVLLLTSENGDAIHDFIFTIDNNNSKLNYDIIDIPVQGHYCPSGLIEKMKNIDKDYDVIVITRGGGSFEDLFGFSKPELIEVVHKFNQPVISAIGHTKDISLLDLVADRSCPTPSLAGQFIIDTNNKYIEYLNTIKEDIKDEMLDLLNKNKRDLNVCTERINRVVMFFDRIQMKFQTNFLNHLQTYSFKLKELELKLENFNKKNETLLEVKDSNNNILNTYDKLKNIIINNEEIIFEIDSRKIILNQYNYKFEDSN